MTEMTIRNDEGAATAIVTNDEGTPFTVRVVRQGGSYGRFDSLTHDNEDPLVEFYDARLAFPSDMGRGQFVSRYLLSTLHDNPVGRGLTLDGGVSAWHVSAQNIDDAIRLADALLRAGLAADSDS